MFGNTKGTFVNQIFKENLLVLLEETNYSRLVTHFSKVERKKKNCQGPQFWKIIGLNPLPPPQNQIWVFLNIKKTRHYHQNWHVVHWFGRFFYLPSKTKNWGPWGILNNFHSHQHMADDSHTNSKLEFKPGLVHGPIGEFQSSIIKLCLRKKYVSWHSEK